MDSGSSEMQHLGAVCSGEGDSTIQLYELTEQEGFCNLLNELRCQIPQKGVAFLPRRGDAVWRYELEHVYRLTEHQVQPVSLVSF